MKSLKLWMLAALILLGSVSVFAQTTPNLENGFKYYGSYDGSHLDTVNLMNGNLMLHLPLVPEFPQRGNKLDLKYLVYLTSKTWTASACGLPSGPCRWSFLGGGGTFQRGWDISLHRTYNIDSTGGQNVYLPGIYTLFTGDGSKHGLYAIPGSTDNSGQVTKYETIDGTGYHVELSNADSVTGMLGTAVITERDGTQYVSAFGSSGQCSGHPVSPFLGAGGYSAMIDNFPLAQGTTCSQRTIITLMTDSNGNQISLSPMGSSPVGTDTMTRSSSSWSTATQTTTDSSGCVSTAPFAYAWLLSYPGPGGVNNQVKLCYANYNYATTFNTYATIFNYPTATEASGTFTLLTTAIRADGSKWIFNYNSTFLDLTSVTLPSGGTIAYTWSMGNQLGSGSRVVTSRTLTDGNGNSSIWNYQWGSFVNGVLTNVATDPMGNDTVHMFTSLGGGGWYETSTLSYQGTQAPNHLLKRVDTAYGTAKVFSGSLGNVFPTSVQTTIYPSGKVSLVTKQYDSGLGANAPIFGNVKKELIYDWGQGTPGALLRETDTTYQWEVNSAYLTAHLLDLPASVIVKDGSGNRVAETDYTYDEVASLTASNVSTQHVSPPGAVRGNLTTVSHWLNTSNSFITSHTNWYDTAEAYQSTDPLGHTTTHSYDSAYAGAYSTQTCSPATSGVTHCVSGTYDYQTGLLTSFTNENATTKASGNTPGDSAHTSNYTYDFMSRLTSAQAPPDAANNSLRAQTSFTFSAPNVFPMTVQRQKSITTALSDSATTTFDGLARSYKTQHAVPGNTATVDTTFDAAGHPATVSNPYFTTTDPTYGVTQNQYDALDRVTQTTKQDGSVSTVAYNIVPVLAIAGDCTQTTDEAGKHRRACTDGLGRLIEVDETGDNFSGSQAAASFTVSGTLQNGTRATGSVTIAGTEQLATTGGGMYCAVFNENGDCVDWESNPSTTIYDSGTVSVTVNGHIDSYSYGQTSTNNTVASGLAAIINADSSAAVTASASGAVVSLTSRTPGLDGNYSLAASSTWDTTDFPSPSFTTSKSGSALTGGVSGSPYDSGTVTVTVGSFSTNVSYAQSGNGTAAQVASALATALSVSTSPVTASASGSTVSLSSKTIGTTGNVTFSCSSSTSQGANFSGPSFTCPPTPSLSGGFNPQAPSLDHAYYATLYQYDALGNLLRVDQKGSAPTDSGQWRTRLFTYNSLSQLLTAYNPESGQITYTYDTDGNLLQKTSPQANQTGSATTTISFCYDELHRVKGKAYSAPACPLSSPVVTYTYDAGTNGKGHLTSLTDQAGSATYSYDVLGRMTSEQRTIAGVSKTLSYDYNLDGSVKTVHYPSGAAVTYTPDSAGRILSAVDSGNNINYVTGVTYGPDSAITGFINGNSGSFAGITNSFSYNKRLQPINMSASSPSQTVFSIGYDFHLGNGASGTDNGNVWGITNYKDNTRNQSFTYDPLNRLTSAQNSGTNCATTTVNGKTAYWGNSYGYDAWGNLLSKTVTKCGGENLSVIAGNDNRLQGGYLYDAAGNMTHDATSGLNYTYDVENRITGAGGYTYTYDGDGNRVEKTNNNIGTLYWYMTLGIVGESDLTGTLKSEYVFFGGNRVARRDLVAPTGVFYYFSDHLKTASVTTDSAGVIKSESDYYPWGGELQFTNNDSNHYKFTGKERDTETGLDYFGARYFSNGLGRFITPDWAAKPAAAPYAVLGDPQSLNLYSYVLNRPTVLVDLDGHLQSKPCANGGSGTSCTTTQNSGCDKNGQGCTTVTNTTYSLTSVHASDGNWYPAANKYVETTTNNADGTQTVTTTATVALFNQNADGSSTFRSAATETWTDTYRFKPGDVHDSVTRILVDSKDSGSRQIGWGGATSTIGPGLVVRAQDWAQASGAWYFQQAVHEDNHALIHAGSAIGGGVCLLTPCAPVVGAGLFFVESANFLWEKLEHK